MVGINPGQLREKVQFYTLNRVGDGAAGFTTSPPSLAFETLASVKPLKSVRGIEAAQLILMQPYEVVIRYAENHLPKVDMIVKCRSESFLVKEITEVDSYKKLIRLTVVKE